MKLRELLQSKKKDYFYLMHLSYGRDLEERKRLWNFAVKENLIGLDLPDLVEADWNTLTVEKQKEVGRFWFRQFNLFCNDMSVGDYVVVVNGQLYLLGIATVEGKHYFDKRLTGMSKTGFFDHIRKVKWIVSHKYEGVVLPERLGGFNGTILKITPHSCYWGSLAKINC